MKNFVTLNQKWEQDQYSAKNPSTLFQNGGFISYNVATLGGATTQFDITNPAGTTFRYTFDGTGTDPVINSTTVPVGTLMNLAAQNFNAANNGLFTVTASGTNFFEVTNASGVAENNVTIGTGSIVASGGTVIPSVAGAVICGLGQEDVLASDVDFTSNRAIAFQEVGPNVYFTIPVAAGSTLTYGTLVGTFVVGEVVTGGTSGATGVVTTDNGSTTMIVTGVQGTFVAENIVGSTSGATAAVSAVASIPGATPAMVGSIFDLLTPEVLDVSATGTQIEVTKYIAANLVEGKVVLFA